MYTTLINCIIVSLSQANLFLDGKNHKKHKEILNKSDLQKKIRGRMVRLIIKKNYTFKVAVDNIKLFF